MANASKKVEEASDITKNIAQAKLVEKKRSSKLTLKIKPSKEITEKKISTVTTQGKILSGKTGRKENYRLVLKSGTTERRNTKIQNTKLLKPGTH